MKIRNGFVSNSSSSSFIVAFPKTTNEKNLRETIFEDDKEIVYFDNLEINDKVMSKIEEQFFDNNNFINVLNELKQNLENYYSYNNSDDGEVDKILYIFDINKNKIFDDLARLRELNNELSELPYNNPKVQYYKETLQDEVNLISEKIVNYILSEINDKYMLKYFYFSDNDGRIGSVLEHGDIFHRLKNVRFSYH